MASINFQIAMTFIIIIRWNTEAIGILYWERLNRIGVEIENSIKIDYSLYDIIKTSKFNMFERQGLDKV